MKKWMVALLAVVVSAGVGQAYASTTTYKTRFVQFKLEKSSGKRTFTGQIDSSSSSCLNKRTVKVIRKHNGDTQTLGKDSTGSKGKFTISLSSDQVKDGSYYAKVASKKYDNGKKECGSAQSGTIKVSSSS